MTAIASAFKRRRDSAPACTCRYQGQAVIPTDFWAHDLPCAYKLHMIYPPESEAVSFDGLIPYPVPTSAIVAVVRVKKDGKP